MNVCAQVRDTLGALAERAAAVRLDARSSSAAAGTAAAPPSSSASAGRQQPRAPAALPPGLYLSRLKTQHGHALGTKSVVQYSVAWVKSQVRDVWLGCG